MVKIEVDTSRDSSEEIRKVIRYLQSHVGDASSDFPLSNSTPESSETFPSSESMMGLFDAPNEPRDDDDSVPIHHDTVEVETKDDEGFIEIVEY